MAWCRFDHLAQDRPWNESRISVNTKSKRFVYRQGEILNRFGVDLMPWGVGGNRVDIADGTLQRAITALPVVCLRLDRLRGGVGQGQDIQPCHVTCLTILTLGTKLVDRGENISLFILKDLYRVYFHEVLSYPEKRVNYLA